MGDAVERRALPCTREHLVGRLSLQRQEVLVDARDSLIPDDQDLIQLFESHLHFPAPEYSRSLGRSPRNPRSAMAAARIGVREMASPTPPSPSATARSN